MDILASNCSIDVHLHKGNPTDSIFLGNFGNKGQHDVPVCAASKVNSFCEVLKIHYIKYILDKSLDTHHIYNMYCGQERF